MTAIPAKRDRVYERGSDSKYGLATGTVRDCLLARCGGRQISVLWPDGKVTYPCLNGIRRTGATTWQII